MANRNLKIIERGLYKYAECERCNTRFVSSRLKSEEADKEIQERYASHHCKPAPRERGTEEK